MVISNYKFTYTIRTDEAVFEVEPFVMSLKWDNGIGQVVKRKTTSVRFKLLG